MIFLPLEPYAAEGRLSSVATARWIRKHKHKAGDGFDFSNIVSVDADFLAALLEGWKPEEIEARTRNAEGGAREALERWSEARSPRRRQPERTSVQVAGDRYTPSRLVGRLQHQFTRYLLGAYPLADPILIETRRRLLETADDGHLLCQQPYLETNARYRSFPGTFRDIQIPAAITSLFERLSKSGQDYDPKRTVLFPSLYTHQVEALERYFQEGKDLIVATGTGSGKTECFLLPLMGVLYTEALGRPMSYQRRGVRCLILYPMNALVNDQLGRLRVLFGSAPVKGAFHEAGARHPLFGMYTGRTPYPGPRDGGKDEERVAPILKYYLGLSEDLRTQFRRLGRYPAKDLEAFFAAHLEERGVYQSGERKGKPYVKHNWPLRLRTGPLDAELLTRQEMVESPAGVGAAPDILITNYSMLEYMLMRPFERPLFEQTRSWLAAEGNQFLVVLDEAHMYRGAKGAEVAFLLRRLVARLGISGHPEKLRVIATSASLGEGEEAAQAVVRFAADLSGKSPSSFRLVRGTREVPKPQAVGDSILADALASVDLVAVHEATQVEDLVGALSPVLPVFGIAAETASGCRSEGDLLQILYGGMKGHPVLNTLIASTAGNARSLKEVADILFPGHPQNLKATEVLLTLGVLARPAPDEPGLVPARLHLMLRPLSGVYACINEACPGRQAHPGAPSSLGKLFTEARTNCDACGARVFEVASCRDCGSPYVIAMVPAAQGTDAGDGNAILSLPDFFWGETEGALWRVELLTVPPRSSDFARELKVHRNTGYVDRQGRFPASETRSLWLAVDRAAGDLRATFERCPVCLPPGSRRTSRILDFRTRGEQPFTALLEAQFSEQPPQKNDPRLPNRGRKVLVFSDGRQKAARLAPALETSHSRDAFRQLLLLAAQALEREQGLARIDQLYPSVLWTCRRRGINLFPAVGEEEALFHQHLRLVEKLELSEVLALHGQNRLQPALAYARQLFSELTDRFYSLAALGLASVEEDPDPLLARPFERLPAIGLTQAEFRNLFRIWVRLQLESNCFLPEGADVQKLRDGWERPEGIDPRKEVDIAPERFVALVEKVLGRDSLAEVTGWLRDYVTSGLMVQRNDLYYFQGMGLVLRPRLDISWLRCDSCGRIHADGLKGVCPDCLGALVVADPRYLEDRTGYHRDQVFRALDERFQEPFGLLTAEHSAQLSGVEDGEAFIKTERYELQFQDVPTEPGDPPIDVLSCTTTMEVGIDIGALSGVALRNVPPHVANYQQRAGRAGRRGRSVASVVTYAYGSSHDAWYFADPSRIISGPVLLPEVYIENQQVLRRHINAFLLQVFFHEVIVANPGVYHLLESLGSVENFLNPLQPWSLPTFEAWAGKNESWLHDRLREWVPAHAWGTGADLPVDEIVTGSLPVVLSAVRESLPLDLMARRGNLNAEEEESLTRQLEEDLLKTLIDRAVIPRYAFPTDVVSFWVPKPRRSGDRKKKRTFEYQPQRELDLALSEYAPGRTLTIDKLRFTSAAIYNPNGPPLEYVLQRQQAYTSCGRCGFVSLQEHERGGEGCPVCGNSRMSSMPFIVPSGFAPDINVKPEVDRGGAVAYAGQTGRAELEVQERIGEWQEEYFDERLRVRARKEYLVTVNKGRLNNGFLVCRECGLAEPAIGPQFGRPYLSGKGRSAIHPHPIEDGLTCKGDPVGPFFLGYKFPTDVLLLRLSFKEPVVCRMAPPPGQLTAAGRVAATSLVEAISLAASRVLQIDEGELAGNWVPVAGNLGGAVDLFLYDTLSGGAGYTRMTREALPAVLDATAKLLKDCTCESGCYRCLLHYGNRFLHHGIDRHLAAALLEHIMTGRVPMLSTDQGRAAARTIAGVLRLRGMKHDLEVDRGAVRVPLIVAGGAVERWIVPHHALCSAEVGTAEYRAAAAAFGAQVVGVDEFLVRHDLPAVVGRVLQ